MSKLMDIGEDSLIKRILKYVDDSKPSKYDDAQLVNNSMYLLKIDGFSAYNSMLPWNTYYDLGWKSVVMVVSDLIAKGGKPMSMVASIGVPPDYDVSIVEEIVKGISDATHVHKAKFIGGDVNASLSDVWIDVAGIGKLYTRFPIPRRNLVPRGCYVVATGVYGLTGAAFLIHYKKLKWRELIGRYENIFKATKNPRINIDTRLSLLKELEGYVIASMDVSDGLAYTLHTLASLNNIAIRITSIPIPEEVIEFSREFHVNAIDLALYGGEEYETVFIVSNKLDRNELETILEDHEASIIGEVAEGEGVYFNDKRVEYKGWDHFRHS